MNLFFLRVLIFSFVLNTFSQKESVSILTNDQGMQLIVNGKDFIINGMNWDYFPIGTNYDYSLWNQTDSFIKLASIPNEACSYAALFLLVVRLMEGFIK